VLTAAPGNGQSFGGIKVVTDNGWFAARPSGTEDVYKIYAESSAAKAICARSRTTPSARSMRRSGVSGA